MDDDSAAAVLLVVKKPRARLKTPPAPHRARSAPLAELCRAVVSTNLERYPPESFGICDPDEWQAIVKFRHASTQPKQRVTASTGLEGRIVPAVAEKVLQAIEDCNPHLAECPVTDTLLWKDCVEYRYRRGCLTRPVALHLPWPLLVQELQGQANLLLQSEVSSEEMRHAIDTLRRSPMNVSLLKDSQVGKTVKRVVKFSTALNDNAKTELRDLLVSWMEMATSDSADVDGAKKDIRESFTQDDLNLAETCYSWRQLFAALHHRNDEIRSIQGKRMREIRKNVSVRSTWISTNLIYSWWLSLVKLTNACDCFLVSSLILVRNSLRFDPTLPNRSECWRDYQ